MKGSATSHATPAHDNLGRLMASTSARQQLSTFAASSTSASSASASASASAAASAPVSSTKVVPTSALNHVPSTLQPDPKVIPRTDSSASASRSVAKPRIPTDPLMKRPKTHLTDESKQYPTSAGQIVLSAAEIVAIMKSRGATTAAPVKKSKAKEGKSLSSSSSSSSSSSLKAEVKSEKEDPAAIIAAISYRSSALARLAYINKAVPGI